jgi:hypothetical protein
MATKSLSTVGVLTLTNGDATDWYDMQHVAAAEYNLVVSGTATVLLEGANETTVATKTDAATSDTFTATKMGTIFEPMPRFVRFRQSAGSGSAIFSWGKSINHKGDLATIAKQGFATTISSDLTPS